MLPKLNQIMIKVPFKVSARAGKLLGRENFSNPEGAIIELVKNSYDADAKNCFVFFDIPTILKKDSNGKEYNFPIKEESIIYIIDNGDGMTEQIIKDYWMQIGTGNKEKDFISDDKRVKTGAKGIGRFALDRLGFETEMWTLSKKAKNNSGSYWKMDWKQFDNDDKSISDINAEITNLQINLKEEILSLVNNLETLELIKSIDFKSGTFLKITNLKDEWFSNEKDNDIVNVFKSLEALIPPKELNIPFEVYFNHFQKPKEFGKVETAFFNDFDYKVRAKYNSESLSVDFEITRNEMDIDVLKKKFTHAFKDSKHPYNIETLEKKTFNYNKPIDKLLKWSLDDSNIKLLKDVGSFDMTFYYLKIVNSIKEGYPYKLINTQERKTIIDKFGGVKVYRDSFRVRPYGDPTNDWLRLGVNAAKSPAGAGQRIGDWRVRPEQTAGIITISRKANPLLIDKSDRGALQENDAFETFKTIISGIIHEFEFDRSKILNQIFIELQKEKKKKEEKEINRRAEELAKKIVADTKKVDEELFGKSKKIDLFRQKKEEKIADSFKETFNKAFKSIYDEKKERDNEEIVQVRSLASLGLIISSFAHELKEVKNNTSVIKYLESIYKQLVPNELKESDLLKDDLKFIDVIKENKEKIKHWVDFSLNSIKKDKRKRTSLNFSTYISALKHDWEKLLKSRNIKFIIDDNTSNIEYDFRAFEMDMNTIFTNLINNSIDSFKNLRIIKERKIELHFEIKNNFVDILYTDNGIGLSDIFVDKDEIFLPFTTSKKDRKGNNIGTGLGMYLVKNVIDDYDGTIQIIESEDGFKTKINLPIRKK